MIIKTQVSENVMFGQGRKKEKRGMKKRGKERKRGKIGTLPLISLLRKIFN